jgi:hypothetical protein
VLTLAQDIDLTSSSGVLLFLLSTGTLGALISAYRFWVNFRTTERGMNRDRIQQATRNERSALNEARLWQARCADLEYVLRREAGPGAVPPLDPELQALVTAHKADPTSVDWDITGGRPE